ncbi:HAMP domain-containing histidine kinase [Ketobacter sp. MCCC 1A13808]|uniref:sensor histidine kinase n=1 Tax=Ketobacter sp. MCCC 1A13808 TaxID=2602738 RepID=UPI0012EB9726|nr:HAMP domain-containing sensor histidine kinase [Ketobacter sp. MCCC 1A13808]MVF13224.1 HAMP domain-containing histidine kinase [Ketobacter sp. MCCC 1A13808]
MAYSLPKKRKGIQSRLIRVFAMQATLVSVATALGVFAAYKIAENVLVKEALTSEAEHYFQLEQAYGEYPLPNTKNMRGYKAHLDKLGSLPAALQPLPPGYGRQQIDGKSPLVLVTERNGERLYLLFKEEQVSKLAIFFGVAPLTLVLILIYSASWFTFRQSQRVISPVVKLAKVVEAANVTDSQHLDQALKPFHEVDADIDSLATAIEHFTFRLQSFVERERTFTRDASHELRTPLAVLKGSLDVLDQMETFTEKGATVVMRMRQTIDDMVSLSETLLMLAREDDGKLDKVNIVINDLIATLVTGVVASVSEGVQETRSTAIDVVNESRFEVLAPDKVLNILFTNLLKNALVHGAGAAVTIRIGAESVTVQDEGPGMNSEMQKKVLQPFYRSANDGKGHGLGLSIVDRLCQRFGWQLEIASEPGKGSAITVYFPRARML